MFTGLIEEVGRIVAVRPVSDILQLEIASELVRRDLRVGDSVAVDGACLTVTGLREGSFSVDVVAETRRRTTLGESRPGRPVNLERALRLGDRLGGHFVQGHVDGMAQIVRLERRGEDYWLEVELPREMSAFVAEKGSIALDGISLTVASKEAERVGVAVIPHTWQQTSLQEKKPGDKVNVEVDILAKYVAAVLVCSRPAKAQITDAWLREHGFA